MAQFLSVQEVLYFMRTCAPIPKLACTLAAAIARYGNAREIFVATLLDTPHLMKGRREAFDLFHRFKIQNTLGKVWANMVAMERY